MNIAIIGTGAYSVALAITLSKNPNNKIKIWSEDEKKVLEYNTTYMFNTIFPNQKLPTSFLVSANYEEVLEDADLVFIMVAAKFVGIVTQNMKPYINKNMHFCIGSKGIEQGSCQFISEVFLSNIKTKKFAILSGPSFAIDLANNEPVGLSIASTNKKTIKCVKNALSGDSLKLRASDDIIGVQICGSIKNVIALAAGIIAGLGYSESTQAFLITESLHDIKELIHKLGGNKKTILSFAGVGDLLLTCTSTKSRNFSFGKLIGSKASKEEISEYLKTNTVEGYYTIKSIHKLIKDKKIKMPIINLINKIIVNNEDPMKLITFLINKK